ncbi:MAG: DUF3520 domain-containing protein [Planctomycetota bacterium]|nr:MAG: DUF3520 domain-containing protein [Planctomycetota bacterium]
MNAKSNSEADRPSAEDRMVDFLLGEMAEPERREFAEALEQDPKLQQQLLPLQKTVQWLQNDAPETEKLAPERFQAVMEEAEREVHSSTSSSRLLAGPWLRRFAAAAAAVLVVAALATRLEPWFAPSDPEETTTEVRLSESMLGENPAPVDGVPAKDSAGVKILHSTAPETVDALGVPRDTGDSTVLAEGEATLGNETAFAGLPAFEAGGGGLPQAEVDLKARVENLFQTNLAAVNGAPDASTQTPIELGAMWKQAQEQAQGQDSLGRAYHLQQPHNQATEQLGRVDHESVALALVDVKQGALGYQVQPSLPPAENLKARGAGKAPDSKKFGESLALKVDSYGLQPESTFGLDPRKGKNEAGVARYLWGDFDVEAAQGAFLPHHWVVDGYGRRYHGRDILHHLRPCREREAPRDMFFRYYGDHPFVDRQRDALSTFALDVDTASYPLTRSYLQQGHLPPKEAVRTEEFLNYFDYQLAAPQEEDFAVQLDAFPSPFGHRDDVRMLRVALKAREVSRADRKPLSLVFVIDSSGSMADGNRLELVKRSLELLVDQLDDQDRVGIITFNSSARRVLDSTPGYERWKIREAIRQLKSGGSTNAEAGLTMGYEMSERHFREQTVNRVILCSDGVANSGETDQKRILDRVRSFSERQVDLTSIGVGMGNHNDVFLEQLANEGNGSCHYVDDFEEAKRVFLEQFTGTLQTVARDVKLQVEFGSSVKRWRQLGYENRSLADQDFRNDAVDAGEVGAGHQIVALYELEMAAEEAGSLATVRLRWKPDGGGEVQERAFSLEASATLSRFGLAQPRLRQAAVVAQFAEVLRRSYWARGDTYERLQEEVGRLVRDLPSDARVRELRDMVERARGLIAALPPQDELAQLLDEARRMRLQQARLEEQEPQGGDLQELLEQVRRQNQELEAKLEEILSTPRNPAEGG